jgi:hypothetical protein
VYRFNWLIGFIYGFLAIAEQAGGTNLLSRIIGLSFQNIPIKSKVIRLWDYDDEFFLQTC